MRHQIQHYHSLPLLWMFISSLALLPSFSRAPELLQAGPIDLCSLEGGREAAGMGNSTACTSDTDCLPPASCHPVHRICCLFPLDQEAPPVGCPKGTRQLRNATGQWLSCTPTRPSSCPGGALCYEDALEPGQFRCCGKDPGEGCGIGQRVLRQENGSSQLCVPGSGAECPGNAVCEWSFSIDRFQCCEPDDGCLGSEAPLFDSNQEVLACSPSSAHSSPACPDLAICRFNFWTASFQCCAPQNGILPVPMPMPEVLERPRAGSDGQAPEGKSIDQKAKETCPPGEIPFLLEPAASEPLSCSSDMDCPPMAHCHRDLGLCCGPPGECPRPGEHPIFDEQGHILLCSLEQPGVCPADSKCRETVDPFSGLPTGQRLCCGGKISFECAASGSPFPNEERPLRCELDNPITCPMDMLCQASNLAGISICCKAEQKRNLCPHGWLPYGQLNIFCHPTLHASCPGHAACILSPTTGQFVCCQPIGANEGKRRKKKRRRMEDAIVGLAWKGTSGLSCPNQDDLLDTVEGGYPRQCTVDQRVPCRTGFLCEPSAEEPQLGVCCSQQRSAGMQRSKKQRHRSRDQSSSGAIYRCPTAAQLPVLRQGQNLFCDMPGQQCPPGSSCQSALNSFAMMICCRQARQTAPVCPEGMRPQQSPIGYVLCELLEPNQCSEGFQCVHSRDDPEQSICCARQRNTRPAASQYICPNQQVLLRDGSGPRFCAPNSQAGCPTGFSCEQPLGQAGVYVCCSIPAQPVCPAGFDVSVDLQGGNPIFCSPRDQSMCPGEASCLPAENRANLFLCCVSREPGRICPQPGQHALLQLNGQPEQCSGPGASCSKPSHTCQLSYTLNNRYVCCGPPGTTVLCADGRETYQQEYGRTVQCNPMNLYSECPASFECALSNMPNMHVCCRRVEAPQPTPQAPTDLPGMPLLPPNAAASTFRPPVEDLGCPVGWSAFEDQKGAHHFCQDALDMTCPHGFSCAQSSVNGIFMCCRLASSIQCPQAYSTLMVNNNPRLCSIGARQTAGLGVAGVPTTAAGSSSSASGAAVQALHVCPGGYTCMQSSVPAVYVCCGSSTTPYTPAGTYTNRAGELACSDGQIPAYLGQYVRFCSSLGQTSECPPSYVCSISNRAGLFLCCHPFPIRRRSALLGHTQADSPVHAVICGPGDEEKRPECASRRAAGSNGAGNGILAQKQLCPGEGVPYKSGLNGGELLLCGNRSMNGWKCPPNSMCQPSPTLEGTRLCCTP